MALKIDFKGKVALVTGISKGIGAGIASVFLDAGCSVSGCGLDEETTDLEMLREKAISSDGSLLYTKTDVTESKELEVFVNSTIKKYGRIDILVSNAGGVIFEGIEECSEELWQQNLDLNLGSHWRISKLCKPYLEKSEVGSIVIIGSNHAYATIAGCAPYNLAKTALKGLVQSIAIEWGPSIRANCIAPGFIDTELNRGWFEGFPNPDKERKRTENRLPVKKLGTPEEIGGFCAFLSSPYAGFMTGATYLVDGGRSALMQDG